MELFPASEELNLSPEVLEEVTQFAPMKDLGTVLVVYINQAGKDVSKNFR